MTATIRLIRSHLHGKEVTMTPAQIKAHLPRCTYWYRRVSAEMIKADTRFAPWFDDCYYVTADNGSDALKGELLSALTIWRLYQKWDIDDPIGFEQEVSRWS